MKQFLNLGVVAALGLVAGIGIAHTQAQQADHKVQICHGTASKTNPYVLISVDRSALAGHFDGTAPGHGKNNYPDYLSVDGTCNSKPSTPPSGPQPS